MESYTASSHLVFVTLLEMPIHISIDEAENDGLIAHESLVV